ncbi:aldo/keto reductase [uncultured Brachyspira sp.]|uniref:aldo/keto reductase n=1 Tax=uncultured Brachyspira sp. TaxID=221953 RepID=UPI0025DC8E05|nr:aldo/keto reductase [uncultured Brachyspira sp.]
MIKVKLNNGIEMPILGLGVYNITDKEELYNTVKWAIDAGYRKFDTAQFYNNEKELGEAIRKTGIKREEVFITTKIWNTKQGYNSAKRSFEESLEKLNTDYADLVLIHWPGQKKDRYLDTYRALENIYQNQKARAIGLSNFEIKHLKDIFAHCNIAPAVNQIERHPNLPRNELIDFCKHHNIIAEAWSPLGRGKLLNNKIINHIAGKYDKTAAQIILRWDIEKNISVIPKSVNKNRIEENINIFDFELDKDDIGKINALENGKRIGPDPSVFDF